MSLSQTVEDYIKSIYVLEADRDDEKGVSTTHIAESLKVSSASVTNMIKKLAEMGLVTYESYYGARLTETGRKIALEIIRHHRLLELYLKEVMGYSWDEVHDEAEKLEHHISEQFEERIAELLNHPTHDPHGDPIPSKDGVMPEMTFIPLLDAETGQRYLIGRVTDQDPELLRYLEKIGMIPGAEIVVLEKAPFNGPLTLRIEKEQRVIGNEVAKNLFVISRKDQDS
jgi:DtxR family transcriptional regulator, Mn-dependent transcriptional regulator